MSIYIRHTEGEESVHFCDVTISELPEALATIKGLYIYIPERAESYTYTSHQIVLEDEAYIEVCVG